MQEPCDLAHHAQHSHCITLTGAHAPAPCRAVAVVCLQATSLLLISGYVIARNARCGLLSWAAGGGCCSDVYDSRCPSAGQLQTACPPYLHLNDSRLRGSEHAVWHGWSREALRGWGQYLQLAIPSIIMICMK